MSDTLPTTDATNWLVNLHNRLSELGTANPHGGTGRWLCPKPFSAESIAPLLGIAEELRLLRQDKTPGIGLANVSALDGKLRGISSVVVSVANLASLEWLYIEGPPEERNQRICPACFGDPKLGHHADCWLRTALDAARQAGEKGDSA